MSQTAPASAPVRREDLFKVLSPIAGKNPVDNGRTTVIVHKTICRSCRGVASIRRHTPQGVVYRESMHQEALLEAKEIEACEHCGAINLSASTVLTAAEPDAQVAAELS